MASEFPGVFRIDLIERDRVLIRSVPLGIRTGQILVSVGMAMNLPHSRMRQPRIDRDLAPQRLWLPLENFGQLKILPLPPRGNQSQSPGAGSDLSGSPIAIRMVDADLNGLEFHRSSTLPRQMFRASAFQSDTGTTEKCLTIQRCCF